MSDAAAFATQSTPLCPGPDPAPRPPRRFVLPRGAVDTHAHVIGLPPDYPIVPDRAYTPPSAPPVKYLGMLDAVGMTYGVLIQVSVHGTDNRLMAATVKNSDGRLRAIAVIAPDVSDAEIDALAAAGVVGCRINTLFGGGIRWEAMETLARRIAPLNWHLQLWVDGRTLPQYAARLARLPVPFVIDHLGYIPTGEGIDHPGFKTLCSLLGDADCWVDSRALTGFRPPVLLMPTPSRSPRRSSPRVPTGWSGGATGRMLRPTVRCQMSAIFSTFWQTGPPPNLSATLSSSRTRIGFMASREEPKGADAVCCRFQKLHPRMHGNRRLCSDERIPCSLPKIPCYGSKNSLFHCVGNFSARH